MYLSFTRDPLPSMGQEKGHTTLLLLGPFVRLCWAHTRHRTLQTENLLRPSPRNFFASRSRPAHHEDGRSSQSAGLSTVGGHASLRASELRPGRVRSKVVARASSKSLRKLTHFSLEFSYIVSQLFSMTSAPALPERAYTGPACTALDEVKDIGVWIVFMNSLPLRSGQNVLT